MSVKSQHGALGRLRRRRQGLLRAIARVEREMSLVERQLQRWQDQVLRHELEVRHPRVSS